MRREQTYLQIVPYLGMIGRVWGGVAGSGAVAVTGTGTAVWRVGLPFVQPLVHRIDLKIAISLILSCTGDVAWRILPSSSAILTSIANILLPAI